VVSSGILRALNNVALASHIFFYPFDNAVAEYAELRAGDDFSASLDDVAVFLSICVAIVILLFH
jgi:hypothetical protein